MTEAVRAGGVEQAVMFEDLSGTLSPKPSTLAAEPSAPALKPAEMGLRVNNVV